MILKKIYGETEGPLGFPLTDRQAFALDTILKATPKDEAHQYRRLAVHTAVTELAPGERADVSWISDESPDRCREVVLAKGMDDSQYSLNPLVTLQHSYNFPPVGRSLWRKKVKDGDRIGIKAKTQYPPRPEKDWPDGKDWPPDVAFGLVQNGLMNAKSIGFLPVKTHEPTLKERDANNWGTVSLVIDEWILWEYACCYIGMNANATVESVSKSLPPDFAAALGIELAPTNPPKAVPFIALTEYEQAIERRLKAMNWDRLAETAVADVLERRRGRV